MGSMKKSETHEEYAERINAEFHSGVTVATCQCGGTYVQDSDGFAERGCTHCEYGH